LWELLEDNIYDIILLDYRLPDGTGVDVLRSLGDKSCDIPTIMITAQGNERIAVQAIQHGAADYLLKSGDYLITLPALIHKTVQAHNLKTTVQRHEAQIRYQALLLDNVRDAVVVWDLDGKITYWNPAAESLFGWRAEERVGRPAAQFYLSTFTPAVTLPRHGEAAAAYTDRRYQHPNGAGLWFSSRVTALRQPDDPERLLGYMDVARDITRSKEAEQALQESEARYRAIVEDYQTEMICRFKPNGMLTFANEVYCRYFGKRREDLQGMNFLYFIPESERPRLVQHLSGFSAQRPTAALEHQVSLPGQGLRWIQRTDRVILDERGRIFEFQSVARDITERKRMEAQIEAAQSHLVQAARLATIGEVAAGMAHQIYNPLTTIIADAQILLRSLPDGNGTQDSVARESAEAIQQAGWRLQAVVQRLMEFSRPAGESLAPVSLNQTISGAAALVNASIEAVGARLETELEEDLPQVSGSFSQLENLWVNLFLLARDALKAAPAGGPQGRIQVVSRRGPNGDVQVEVRDNGVPIPAEYLTAVFEPNFVGPTSGRGTGLELSICREIVRQHNGQISAECGPERDTILRVSFPAEG
jgi:PAS domain S-box-containing protein